MAGVTAQLSVSLNARLTGAPVGGDTPQYNATIDRNVIFSPGVATVNNADLLYRATRTLAASANEDLDLAGVLTNALGAQVNAAEVVAIVIEAANGNTNDVRYGPAASGGALLGFADATDRRAVAPGDFDVLTCRRGWPVTATTADKLNVANGAAGTPVTYTITVIGRSVAA
jgi:hypothetical protein